MSFTIIEDSRNKVGKHERKHQYWNENGIGLIRSALPYGDYIKAPSLAIDTKQDLAEIGNNMCGSVSERKRFTAECIKAKEAGCKLIFLVENNKNVHTITDLYGKQIYLHSGRLLSGDQLATAMHVMSERYGCSFMFCNPKDSARIITETLENG